MKHSTLIKKTLKLTLRSLLFEPNEPQKVRKYIQKVLDEQITFKTSVILNEASHNRDTGNVSGIIIFVDEFGTNKTMDFNVSHG